MVALQSSSNKQIYLLDQDRIDFYWRDIVGLLYDVPMFWDLYTPEYVYERAKMGHYQVWALSDGAIKGIVISTILDFPKAKIFYILAAAGKDLLKYFDEAEALFEWLSKDSGCDYVQAMMRPGLARKLRGRGTAVGVLLTRAVKHERVS